MAKSLFLVAWENTGHFGHRKSAATEANADFLIYEGKTAGVSLALSDNVNSSSTLMIVRNNRSFVDKLRAADSEKARCLLRRSKRSSWPFATFHGMLKFSRFRRKGDIKRATHINWIYDVRGLIPCFLIRRSLSHGFIACGDNQQVLPLAELL